MTEMVDRARLAFRAAENEWDKFAKTDRWPGDPDFEGEFIVRAIIAALREPTAEMIDAGTDDYPGEGFKADGRLSAVTIWEAMIDAALETRK